MDDLDRALIELLQDGLPVLDRPFAEVATRLGIDEPVVRARLSALLDAGVLTRFGPLFDPAALGGAVVLAAMAVPGEHFGAVAATVNAFPEVAHNYARDHVFNMWFVIAADSMAAVEATARAIERHTGIEVLLLPKEEEYCLHLRLSA